MYVQNCLKFVLLTVLAGWLSTSFAIHYSLSANIDIVGEPRWVKLQLGQNLQTLGQRYNLGYYEVLEANPTIHPKLAERGTEVLLATQFILPNAPREGVIVNIAELRLYLYPDDNNEVITLPIGIGKPGRETPLGKMNIYDKRKDPTWYIPESIYYELKSRGMRVSPEPWPPSPKNPLGKYAMRLSLLGYDIHGTNKDTGVGRRTSAGCIRMYNDDVAEVFHHVEVGTPVRIINQPYKIGIKDSKIYLEAHKPLQEDRKESQEEYLADVKAVIKKFMQSHKNITINWRAVANVINSFSGIPVEIGYLS